MQKKLQIFISSTFTDLIDERQSAVEAILNAGHIPAGMELFKAGVEQLDTIKRWIDESDIYMLILGGRYGSIESESGKSYTHVEYEYAIQKNIPVFAVVLKDEYIQEKIRKAQRVEDVKEIQNHAKYLEFKEVVTSKICEFADDLKDIKLAVHKTLSDFQNRYTFTGWVSGKDFPNTNDLIQRILKLEDENDSLKARLKKESTNKIEIKDVLINGFTFIELYETLLKTKITVPAFVSSSKVEREDSVLSLFIANKDAFIVGVTDYTLNETEKFFYYHVAPKLMVFNLVEKMKITGKRFEKMQISKDGKTFLALYEVRVKSR